MSNVADGYSAIAEAALRGARPDPELRVDEWAEEFMVVPKDAAKPGRYRIAHTPMARRILQVLSPRHPCRRVAVKGASQMLKTQVALCWLLASAHRAPANMLVLEPTDGLVKRLSARVQKAIRDVCSPTGEHVLQRTFSKPRSRDSRNTVAAKDFEGGTMYLATAGSAANLAEIPARYVYIDEASRLEESVDGEGDVIALAEARQTTFDSNSKLLVTSSPKDPGDVTDQQFERGTQEVYLVPCPHCGHHHELTVERFKYERDPDTGWMARAWFVCPECGAEIDERHKARMLRDAALGGTAHWHARAVGDGETVSFHVSAFYAPVGSITWVKLARELANARAQHERGSPNALQAFYNTRLALSWANTEEQTTAQELMSRAALPPRVVPDWALVVTLAADTQHNRVEVQAHAWGPGLQHAVIDHQVFVGSPTIPPEDPRSPWHKLDEYRRTPFAHASGVLIQASVYAVDSGGLNTQDVYNYGSARVHQGCLVVHGSSRPNKPIVSTVPTKADIDWNGKRVDGGVLLWTIGTDTAKDHLHNRMRLTEGWGSMHFATTLPLDWFEQLLAEVPKPKRLPSGGTRRVWAKRSEGDRNEALDMAVYNLACAHYLALHKWAALDWQRLRAKLVPAGGVTPDLFVSASPAPPPADLAVVEPGAQAAAVAAVAPTPPPAPATAAASGRRLLSRGIAP
jgi:phage terminase large subunit GpA-like protein